MPQTIRFHLDEHGDPRIARGLRRRGIEVREARVSGEYLFIRGEQIEDDDVDDEGYGIILVAKRCPDRDSMFWTLIAHTLYPETLEYMTSLPPSRIHTPPAGGTDG